MARKRSSRSTEGEDSLGEMTRLRLQENDRARAEALLDRVPWTEMSSEDQRFVLGKLRPSGTA